jgi:hypothetical protein
MKKGSPTHLNYRPRHTLFYTKRGAPSVIGFFELFSERRVSACQDSTDSPNLNFFSIFLAIEEKSSPNVVSDIVQLQTNIIFVHLNESRISAADFAERLSKVRVNCIFMLKRIRSHHFLLTF